MLKTEVYKNASLNLISFFFYYQTCDFQNNIEYRRESEYDRDQNRNNLMEYIKLLFKVIHPQNNTSRVLINGVQIWPNNECFHLEEDF